MKKKAIAHQPLNVDQIKKLPTKRLLNILKLVRGEVAKFSKIEKEVGLDEYHKPRFDSLKEYFQNLKNESLNREHVE